MQSVAESRGMAVPRGFSARELFQRIANTVRPIPAMIRAVQLIKEAGETKQKRITLCPKYFLMIFPRQVLKLE